MADGRGDEPAASDGPTGGAPARPRWRSLALALALVGGGFLGGLLAAPWLNLGGWLSGSTSVAVERRARVADDAPLPVTPSDRREAARLLLAASSLASAAAPPPPAAAATAQESLSFDRLPAPVREALSRLAAGKPLQRMTVSERLREGVSVFDIRFDLEAVEHEVVVDPQGKLIEAEMDIAVAELPHSVSEQVFMAVPDAVVIDAEKHESENEPPFYEVTVRAGGARRELRIGEGGEILRNRLK